MSTRNLELSKSRLKICYFKIQQSPCIHTYTDMGADNSKQLLVLPDDVHAPEDDINWYVNAVQTGNAKKANAILHDLAIKYKGHSDTAQAIARLKRLPFAVKHLPALDPFHEFDIDKTLASYT